jgi:FAD/FMN-containing dehydrogenase
VTDLFCAFVSAYQHGDKLSGAADRDVRARWASEFARALGLSDAAYVGFLSDDGPSRIHDAYPDATWDRLTRIKAMYDPNNLFRLNHNIPPRGERVARES